MESEESKLEDLKEKDDSELSVSELIKKYLDHENEMPTENNYQTVIDQLKRDLLIMDQTIFPALHRQLESRKS